MLTPSACSHGRLSFQSTFAVLPQSPTMARGLDLNRECASRLYSATDQKPITEGRVPTVKNRQRLHRIRVIRTHAALPMRFPDRSYVRVLSRLPSALCQVVKVLSPCDFPTRFPLPCQIVGCHPDSLHPARQRSPRIPSLSSAEHVHRRSMFPLSPRLTPCGFSSRSRSSRLVRSSVQSRVRLSRSMAVLYLVWLSLSHSILSDF